MEFSIRRHGMALALVAWSVAGVAVAQQKKAAVDSAKGQQIANQVCGACHGADGNSVIPANPKLAGQHAEYLVKQLNDYSKPATDKSARVNAVMAGFAAGLSPEDRRNVAAWFASQAAKPGAAKNKETLDLGQRIYRAGIPEKQVPACSGCHSPNGAGIPAQYPRLGGQYAEYVEGQLKALRDGTRRNNLAMTQIAERLSEKEMQAVADYIAGLR
jgi:cytochrome c553